MKCISVDSTAMSQKSEDRNLAQNVKVDKRLPFQNGTQPNQFLIRLNKNFSHKSTLEVGNWAIKGWKAFFQVNVVTHPN